MNEIGTIDNPYDLATALASPAIGAGDTLYLRGGIYALTVTSLLSGSKANPVVIKAYPGEQPKITGRVNIAGQYSTWEGIEFHFTGWTARENTSTTPADIGGETAVAVSGTGTKMTCCIVHDGAQGIDVGGATDVEIRDCLIYHTGWKNSINAYGHGLYPQNLNNPSLWNRFINCILIDTFGYGFHAYSTQDKLDYLHLEKLIVANAGVLMGVYQPNTHVGGQQWSDHLVVKDCATLYAGLAANGDSKNRIGYGSGNLISNITFTGNYFTGASNDGNALQLLNTPDFDVMAGNEIYGSLSPASIPTDYPDNTYGNLPTTGSKIIINARERGGAHVVIYNWEGADTITIPAAQLSGILAAGDGYKLHNAQDYFVDTVTGTVAGNGTLAVDMRAASHTVATPCQWVAPASTFPRYGVFVLEAL